MVIAIVTAFDSESQRMQFNKSLHGHIGDEQRWEVRGPEENGVWRWEGPPWAPTGADGRYGIAILVASRADYDSALELLRGREYCFTVCLTRPPYCDLAECTQAHALAGIK